MLNLEDSIERYKMYKAFVDAQNAVMSSYWVKNSKDFDSELKSNGWKNLGKQDFFSLRDSKNKGLKSISSNPINNSFINNQNFYEKIKKNLIKRYII